MINLAMCSLDNNNIGIKYENGNWVAAPEAVAALAEGIAKCQNLRILRYAFAVAKCVSEGDVALPDSRCSLIAAAWTTLHSAGC